MNNDKKLLYKLGMAMLLVVAGTLVFYFIAFSKEDLNLQSYIWIILVFVILIVGFVIFIKQFQDVKKGMPLKDERSKQVLNLAASRAFYVTLYWLLAISIFEKFFAGFAGQETLDASQTAGGGILGMAIAYFGFWFYYNRKGNI